MAHKKINVFFWNSRSIRGKIDETFDYLIDNKIDIAAFNETWLKPIDVLYHPEFKCYRNDRITGIGGGVAIIIRREIEHTLLPLNMNLKIIEAIGIQVKTSRGLIDIFGVYFPGTRVTSEKIEFYSSDIEKLTTNLHPFFICGDLNSKHSHWNCNISYLAGNALFNLMTRGTFTVQHSAHPTFFSPRGIGSNLDIMLTNDLIQYSDLISSSDLSSDHLPVEFSILIESNKKIIEHTIPRYDLANWELYSKYINENIDLSSNSRVRNIENDNEIDELIKNFSEILLTAQNIAIPVSNVKNLSTLVPIRITPEINLLIRLRKIRRQQWQRNRDPILKSIVNQLNKTIAKEIQQLRNNRWEKHLENIEDNSNQNYNKKLWKTAKILRSRRKGIPTLIIPPDPQISETSKIILLISSLVHQNL